MAITAALAHWDGYELHYRLSQGEPEPFRSVLLPELRAGHVEGVVYAVGGDSKEHSVGRDDPLLGALLYSEAVVRELATAPDDVAIVRTRQDLVAARASGAIWFVLGLEGCAPLRGELAVLRSFHRLGVRCIGLTWNGRNEAADGVGVRSPGGLTEFGRRVIEEVNALGGVIDVSHLAARGLREVAELSAAPLLASHSNAKALRDFARNLTDEELRLVVASGGVVGVNFMPAFLTTGEATIGDLANHIDHIASVVGIDHVALGPDFTYEPWRASIAARSYQGVKLEIGRRYPVHRPGELDLLRSELERRGMRGVDIAKVFSGNLVALLMRVLPDESSGIDATRRFSERRSQPNQKE